MNMPLLHPPESYNEARDKGLIFVEIYISSNNPNYISSLLDALNQPVDTPNNEIEIVSTKSTESHLALFLGTKSDENVRDITVGALKEYFEIAGIPTEEADDLKLSTRPTVGYKGKLEL